MAKYNVIEKFYTIDGEGPTAGKIATFIRFGGCNLHCTWCDTAYSIPMDVKGTYMTEEEIYAFIQANGASNVTLTGGEPLIQKDIEKLLIYLSKDSSLTIHLETNGSLPIQGLKDELREANCPDNVVFILDYKLPSSKMESLMDLELFNQLSTKDVYKFVIASYEDLEVAKEVVTQYNLTEKCLVYFSPAFGEVQPAHIVEFMKKHRMNQVRLQLQLHKIIWSPDTREV